MSRRFQLACYVSEEVCRAFVDRARAHNITVASSLRQLVLADLYSRSDPAELRQNLLFLTIALDGLLQAHPDPDLRPRLLKIWRDRIAEEGLSHAT